MSATAIVDTELSIPADPTTWTTGQAKTVMLRAVSHLMRVKFDQYTPGDVVLIGVLPDVTSVVFMPKQEAADTMRSAHMEDIARALDTPTGKECLWTIMIINGVPGGFLAKLEMLWPKDLS